MIPRTSGSARYRLSSSARRSSDPARKPVRSKSASSYTTLYLWARSRTPASNPSAGTGPAGAGIATVSPGRSRGGVTQLDQLALRLIDFVGQHDNPIGWGVLFL